MNRVLDVLEGYPELDPDVEDIQHGLLNRYRLDYVYYRGMAKTFYEEAIHSSRLYVHQHGAMEKKGYKLPAMDLHQLPRQADELSLPPGEAMDTDGN